MLATATAMFHRAMDVWREQVARRPRLIAASWLVLAAFLTPLSPNLTRLAAEGQAHLLPTHSESSRAASLARSLWPHLSWSSNAVVVLHRAGGLLPQDHEVAQRLNAAFSRSEGRPAPILRVVGPNAETPTEVRDRLISSDRTMQLVVVPLSTAFVAPASQDAVRWLEARAAEVPAPAGLTVAWTGDAVIGRDYMAAVQTSLDRAAVITVVLILGVLLAVYRSIWLAMVPLLTIGLSLLISRSVLAWMAVGGWEVSPLVELFLIVVLFGCGTDLCLFLSWRYGELFNPANPAGSLHMTLRRVTSALATSAFTVIVGLSLMGTTDFKLFSSTGPSVALGLAITLLACLTLTPALLVLVGTYRPGAFHALDGHPSRLWDKVGALAMGSPVRSWLVTFSALALVSALGFGISFVNDMLTELPRSAPPARTLAQVVEKFGAGTVAPLTVLIRSEADLRGSEGLALIDDISRMIQKQKRIGEVRSATQPLGSPEPLARARLASRLTEINDGFAKMQDGATQLQEGLYSGSARLQTGAWLADMTGLPLLPKFSPTEKVDTAPAPKDQAAVPASWNAGLNGISRRLGETARSPYWALSPLSKSAAAVAVAASSAAPTSTSVPTAPATGAGTARPTSNSTVEMMVQELQKAAEGAGRISEGAARANHELNSILRDPVGRSALNRLLVTPDTIRQNPELRRSFAAYISPDGKTARIDVAQQDRLFSSDALDKVESIRSQLSQYVTETEGPAKRVLIAGPNAESADIRSMTQADQFKTWLVVPIGVFLVLMVTLRDIGACVNLVATMVLTYLFSLGATHIVFVTAGGAPGIDWKVPYFLFVLLIALGVDYNIFLMARIHEEAEKLGLKVGIRRAIGQTGALITSAAAITACSFAAFLFSPLASLRQLGFALVIGIAVDALLVRPLLVPCGHWLLYRRACRVARSSPDRIRTYRPAHVLVGGTIAD